MVGGLLQLAIYGNEDIYLTGNPQMTFFKSIYRRHTNFSMENLEVQFIGDRGHIDFADTTTKKISCNLDVNGDLIGNIYFVMRIPNIYTYDLGSNKRLRFRWVKNLAFNMIKSVSVLVGGKEITKHTGEWMHILNEMTLEKEQKNVLNRITGNIPELYDPKNDLGNYPESLTTGTTPPSIRGRLIYIPLSFWFNTKPGLALPILALQYNKVELVVELNSLDNIYTLECYDSVANTSVKYKPKLIEPSSSDHIKNFLVGTEKSDLGWGLNPYVEVNYIFLDNEERKLFGEMAHEYLIEQVNHIPNYGIKTENFISNLLFYNPTKMFVFVCKRSDSKTRNDHNNYTNWFDKDVNPLLKNFSHYEEWYDENRRLSDKCDTASTYKVGSFALTRDNYDNFSKDIINQCIIKFNGLNRIKEKSNSYFSLLQKHQHGIKTDDTGILIYSFSINPNQFEPSGSVNLSGLNKLTVEMKLNEILQPSGSGTYLPKYDYDIDIYQVNYNIFRVAKGFGSVVFNS